MFHFKSSSSLGRFRRKQESFFNRCFLKSHSKPLTSWKVLFYGTDELSKYTLTTLDDNRLSPDVSRVVQSLDVVCKQSDCAVRRFSVMRNLNIHTWPFDVPLHVYDVGIVVSFGHMIPSSSIFACKYGIINAHPSLLPRWRGAAPIFHTILSGDTETGVTITQVSPNKFDIGNILMQELYSVPEKCTSKKLTEDLGKLAAAMVIKTLQNLPYYIEASYPQPKVGVTLARKIKPDHCYINWVEDTVAVIDRKCRAYYSFFDLWTFWKDLKISILEVVPPYETKDAKISSLLTNPVSPGYCYFHKKRKILFVKCKDGWSGIRTIKIPKKGKIAALDFYNGFISKEDTSKCYFTSKKPE